MAKRFFLGLLTALLLCVSAAAFSDVPPGHWAAEDIDRCVEAGYLTTLGGDTFGLGVPMTRGGFAVALDRFFGWEDSPLAAPFTDIAPGAWYETAVNAAYAQGVLPTWEGAFRPDDPITREEMAVLLLRALGWGELAGLAQNEELPFTDVRANRGYLALCYDFALLSGTASTTFSPDAPATREQAAAVLMRLWDRLHAGVERIAVMETWQETDCDTAVLTGARLLRAKVSGVKSAPVTDRPVLLGVSAKAVTLTGNPEVMAQALAQAVADFGYDGLYLDIPGVTAKHRTDLTALAEATRRALGEERFLLAADSGKDGYDWAALAAVTDTLVLRPAQIVEQRQGFTAAPVAASEDCWKALRAAGTKNAALLLSDAAHGWKNGKETDVFAVETLPEHAAYSARYECSYWQEGGKTVWCLGQKGAAQRLALTALMGCGSVAVVTGG